MVYYYYVSQQHTITNFVSEKKKKKKKSYLTVQKRMHMRRIIPTTITIFFLCIGLLTCDWITQNTFLSLDLSRELRKHHLVFLGKGLEKKTKKNRHSPSQLACRQSHPVSPAVCRSSTQLTSWRRVPILLPPYVQGHSRSSQQAGR